MWIGTSWGHGTWKVNAPDRWLCVMGGAPSNTTATFTSTNIHLSLSKLELSSSDVSHLQFFFTDGNSTRRYYMCQGCYERFKELFISAWHCSWRANVESSSKSTYGCLRGAFQILFEGVIEFSCREKGGREHAYGKMRYLFFRCGSNVISFDVLIAVHSLFFALCSVLICLQSAYLPIPDTIHNFYNCNIREETRFRREKKRKKAVQNKSGGAGRFKMCKLVKNIKITKSEN
jgi:hypothetical protein